MPTSILVDRLLLIKALEKEQAGQMTQFKRDMERWRKEEATYPERLLAAMEKALKKIKAGWLPTGSKSDYSNGRHAETAIIPDIPVRSRKPSRNGNACEVERMIATLKLSTKKDVRIGEKSAYVRFVCKVNR